MKHASKRHDLRHEGTGRFVPSSVPPDVPSHGAGQYQMPADEREAWPSILVDRDGRLGSDGHHDRPGFAPCGKRGRGR